MNFVNVSGERVQHHPRDGLLVLRGGQRGRAGRAERGNRPGDAGAARVDRHREGQTLRARRAHEEDPRRGRRRGPTPPRDAGLPDAPQGGLFYPNSAWCTPFVGGSYEFLDNGVRLLDARSFFFFYATGITPAMAWKMAGAGAQYAAAFVDAKGGRSTAASATGCTCPAHPGETSGRWCSTTTRPGRCCRPTSRTRASAARRAASRAIRTGRSTSTSARSRRPARRTTGCRPGPARAGT